MCDATTYSYVSGCSTTAVIPLGTAPTSASIVYYPNVTYYPYSWNCYGYHAPKCVNCGYCPCCQRSDVQEQVDAVPGDGDNS